MKKEKSTWFNMKDRCLNVNHERYLSYGGRGISVCDEWLIFDNFIKDMGLCPDGMTLDRIDNNKGYYKENCRWADITTQQRNRGLFKNNKSGVTGVHLFKRSNKWKATIYVNGKMIYLGLFSDLKDAVKARKEAEVKYW
jgi:hypothetical protein